jgi:uncharacterized protein (TIGR03435 family)
LAREVKPTLYLRHQEDRQVRRTIIGAGLVLFACSAVIALAADGPKFEVASVRRAAPPPDGAGVRDGARGGPGTSDPSQVTYTSLRLKDLLLTAYGLKSYQISGPDWLDTERYDISAKIPMGATKEQFALMLQALLTERFKLTLHRETKDQPLYELVVAKNGPKLKPWVDDPSAPPPTPTPGAPPAMGKDGFPIVQPGHFAMMAGSGRLHIAASKLSLARLTDMLASQLGRPVVDKTGLIGEYDYTLEFSPAGLAGGILAGPPPPAPLGAASPPSVNPASDQDALSLLNALQEQLGLKLEQKKGPVDVLIIDHAEKIPTAN